MISLCPSHCLLFDDSAVKARFKVFDITARNDDGLLNFSVTAVIEEHLSHERFRVLKVSMCV